MNKLNAMGILLMFAAAVSAVSTASARESRHSAFQFSFFPPLGTNGIKSAEYTNGASVNLMVGVSAGERSLVLSGFGSIVRGSATGAQIAGLWNHVGGDGAGLAAAGLTNTTKRYAGVQIAGLANASKDLAGMQIAGMVNVAGDLSGVQLAGLVNVARKVKGVQLAGLVNIAEESDWPVGLVNIVRKGEMGIGASYDLLGNAMVAFRSGGRCSYGIVGVGFNHRAGNSLAIEAGYGIHIPVLPWLRVSNEFKAMNISTGSSRSDLNFSWLLAPSFVPGRHFNIFGGPSLNYFMPASEETAGLVPESAPVFARHGLNSLYLGFQAGIQYIF